MILIVDTKWTIYFLLNEGGLTWDLINLLNLLDVSWLVC